MMLHPGRGTLVRFADDELDAPTTNRVAGHLRTCTRCQDFLRFVRSVERAAAALPSPTPSDDVLSRVLASRHAGARTILPAAPVESHPRRSRWVAVAAVAAAAIVTVVAMPRRSVIAGESVGQLSINPAAPRKGQRLEVQYHAAAPALANAGQLVLRGRLRTPRSGAYQADIALRVLDTLTRDGKGVFHGSFVLPDSVVYAALAVETTDAASLDDNDGRAWEVMLHDERGRPLPDALEQRQDDFMGVSWEEAYASARRRAELYPGSISAWNGLAFYEQQLLGAHAADSIHALRKPMLDSLLARYRVAPDAPPEEISAIAWASYLAKDSSALDYWYDRLARADVHDPQVAQIGAVRLANRFWESDPARLRDSLEALWQRVAPVHSAGFTLVSVGQQLADRMQDTAGIRRWAVRGTPGDSLEQRGLAFVRHASTRADGMRLLRAALARGPRELADERPLSQTRKHFETLLADRRRRMLAALGDALIASGQTRGGLDTLTLATAGGWDLPLMRRVLATRLSIGDTAGAIPLQARLAADPRTPAWERDSLERFGAMRVGRTRWSSEVANARRLMITTVLAAGRERSVRGNPTLDDSTGGRRALRDLTRNRPTLLVFWSRNCGYALQATDRIAAVAASLREQGIPTLFVADEERSPALSSVLKEKGVRLPVFFDARREVATSIRAFGTPTYYVLDGEGRIRFVDNGSELEEVPLQFEALRLAGTAGMASQ